MNQIKTRSHLYVRWLFLRIVCCCFFAAFLSVAVQIVGLYGTHGILPLKDMLEQFNTPQNKLYGMLVYPSVFWWNCSDSFMQIICFSGAALSLVALCGIFTGPILFVLWYLYLSIVSLGQVFMGFQWDYLLLETGLLAAWFAPWGMKEIHPFNKIRFESQAEPSYIFLFLIRLLCFKLMMFSGLCKLTSQDATWSDLTAMAYHYETQPLPTPLSWFMQKFPLIIQKLTTLSVFVVELILPASLLLFWRQARIVAACSFILLQILIMFTGNYTFFNWLTIALCLTLFDDETIQAFIPRSMRLEQRKKRYSLRKVFFNTALSLIPGLLLVYASTSYLIVMAKYGRADKAPAVIQAPLEIMAPFRSISSYGLFAIMTTTRPEIIIEGSNDGVTWLPYEFKFKPGDIKRPPPIVAPHQPRLDWQMWFASLGTSSDSPWFDLLVKEMLEGSPDVLALFEKNPFQEKAPKYIRAEIYDYHFSDWDALLKRGEWWKREYKEEFYPPTSLSELI